MFHSDDTILVQSWSFKLHGKYKIVWNCPRYITFPWPNNSFWLFPWRGQQPSGGFYAADAVSSDNMAKKAIKHSQGAVGFAVQDLDVPVQLRDMINKQNKQIQGM